MRAFTATIALAGLATGASAFALGSVRPALVHPVKAARSIVTPGRVTPTMVTGLEGPALVSAARKYRSLIETALDSRQHPIMRFTMPIVCNRVVVTQTPSSQ